MKVNKIVSVCVVEDNIELLENLAPLIELLDDLSLAGAYTNAEDALEQANWQQVDVLLSDIDLPGMTGVELIRAACALNPDLLSLAYTVYEDRETVFGALEAGAYGYVLKGNTFDELVDAIRQLVQGGAPMSAAVARKVICNFHAQSAIEHCEPLSVREKNLLVLVSDGLGYKEIASQLHISTHTVHAHIRNIYGKLHASNRSEALAIASKLGYLVDKKEVTGG